MKKDQDKILILFFIIKKTNKVQILKNEAIKITIMVYGTFPNFT